MSRDLRSRRARSSGESGIETGRSLRSCSRPHLARILLVLLVSVGLVPANSGVSGAQESRPQQEPGQAESVPRVRFVDPDPAEPAAAPEGHLMVHWEIVTEDGVPEGDAQDGAEDDAELVFELELVDRGVGGKVWNRKVGRDLASFLSGLAAGQSTVRVRAWRGSTPGPWSEPLEIEVEYPSRRMVNTLMVLGTLLFVATVVLVLWGHKSHAGTFSLAPEEEGG